VELLESVVGSCVVVVVVPLVPVLEVVPEGCRRCVVVDFVVVVDCKSVDVALTSVSDLTTVLLLLAVPARYGEGHWSGIAFH